MSNIDKAWAGTKLKFVVNVTIDGTSLTALDLDNYEVRIVFRSGGRSVELGVGDLQAGSNNEIIAPLDTSMLGAGAVWMITYVTVSDSDFADGKRVEVDKQQVLYIKEV